jgi:hypothetical protein
VQDAVLAEGRRPRFSDEDVQPLLPGQVLQQAVPGLRLAVGTAQDGVPVLVKEARNLE